MIGVISLLLQNVQPDLDLKWPLTPGETGLSCLVTGHGAIRSLSFQEPFV